MKSKHKSCVTAAAVAAGAGEKMKSVILYPYGPLTATGCCRMLHAKNLAIASAIYTINISLLIVLIYSWRINININKSGDLEDVYYGVQIAYFAIIGTQMSMIILSVMLLYGILKENPGLIVPWIIGYITFMALEAVAMVYSNVLRDHVNKQFDAMCKAEVAFFIARAFINVLSMWGVLRFYNLVRCGITWKGPEAKTALTASPVMDRSKRTPCECQQHQQQCQNHHYHHYYRRPRSNSVVHKASGGGFGCCAFFDLDYDYDNDEDDDLYDYEDGDDFDCDEDEDGNYYDEEGESSDCSMLGASPNHKRVEHKYRQRNNNIRSVLVSKRHNKYKITHPETRLEVINESERSAGSGSDENDSLLVAYDSTPSLASV
ncbi:uncharacterized protein LOC101898116 [Musca domestica]|uniref:Uncharacterized protein LOC101898116 n=1 Tax=Musca domestica TaxID=7370 RepID=A0A9J7CKI9_MUSDO|nr:uncharacterized protein LOC101898116 [Musca domestica]XP_011296422.2 uncharacterized protein LOC101898116 [Musca domestica]XP_058980129.1 uncharacterized protein LOC101898116 [Musca domestica]XP_058980130.1 uncharacterized protein LOC101898116 [Musca domestica]